MVKKMRGINAIALFAFIFIFQAEYSDALLGKHENVLCGACHTDAGGFRGALFDQTPKCLGGACHTPATQLTTVDASRLFNYTATGGTPQGTSHAWGVAWTNPGAGAVKAVSTGVSSYQPPGVLGCSSCHWPHYYLDNLTSQPLLKRDNSSDQLCLDCHRSRDRTNASSVEFGKQMSHPVGVVYPEVDPAFNIPPLDPYGVSGSELRLVGPSNDTVSCSTCHGVHFADSNPWTGTYDTLSAVPGGKGVLLRRYNDSQLCRDCHRYMGHNGMDCRNCHKPHNIGNNFYLIMQNISTPEINGNTFGNVTVTMTNLSSGFAYISPTGPVGICEACHRLETDSPSGSAFQGWSAAHSAMGINKSEAASFNCLNCHAHVAGDGAGSFGGCGGCHGMPPKLNSPLTDGYAQYSSAVLGSYNYVDDSAEQPARDESTSPHKRHAEDYPFGSQGAGYGTDGMCRACHANDPALHKDKGFQDVAFGLYSWSAGQYGNYDQSPASRNCTNVYCHSKPNMDSTVAAPNTVVNWNMAAGTLDCGSCHDAKPSTNKHTKHIDGTGTNYNFGCRNCHSQTASNNTTIANELAGFHVNRQKDVFFTATAVSGSYAAPARQCSDTYCHGNLANNQGNNSSPVFDVTGTAPCGSCHDLPPSGDIATHTKHVSIYGFECAYCHWDVITTWDNVSSIDDQTKHVNYNEDVRFGNDAQGRTNADGSYDKASGKCSTIYCHSAGTSTLSANFFVNESTVWNSATVTCSSCHGNSTYSGMTSAMPNYTSVAIKSNSHYKHVVVNGYGCNVCHNATVNADNVSINDYTKHVNGQYNIDIAASYDTNDVAPNYTAGSPGGTCESISCHGTGTPVWGSAMSCTDCHAGSGDVDDFTFGNNTTARIDSSEWINRGHGRPSGNYPFSTNAAANTSCLYSGSGTGCHSSAVSHNDPTNPFRLYTAASHPNDLCKECHKTGQAKVVVTHSRAEMEAAGYDGGASGNGWGAWDITPKCVDCHDPHGDKNNYMIHTYINMSGSTNYGQPTEGATAFMTFTAVDGGTQVNWESYVKPDFSGICQRCHSQEDVGVGVFKKGTYTADHNNDTNCPNCHEHSKGFKPTDSDGNNSCFGCHNEYFEPMNSTDGSYHHYLNNSDVYNLASGSKYPVLDPPSPLGGTSDQNRRCLMCHVDHDIFKPELNPQSPGRSYNLRPNINTFPTITSGRNTDFLPNDPYGGLCLSCHNNSQTKSFTQADGTVQTPVVNKEMFIDSPHNYVAPSTFNSGATQFNANCSKCHVDTMTKTKQAGGNTVGPHFSQIRRINAVAINENNYGTATGGASTTLTDTAKSWATDIWAGSTVTILEGSGSGQSRTINGNNATTITVSSSFSPAPSTDSVYLIGLSRGVESGMSTGGNTTTTLNDTAATWTTNYWADRPVTIVKGTGFGQTGKIISNTATTFTLYTSTKWSVVPDSTSKYSIGDPSEEEVCFRCHSEQRNPNAAAGQDFFGVKDFENSKTLRMEKMFNDPAKPYKHRIDRYFAKHRGDESETAPNSATATGWFADASGGIHSGCQDCHNPHANRKPGEDSGVAEGGSNLTLVDSDKNWSQDQWRGYILRIMDGTGRGQDRMIVKNDATTLTLAVDYITAPAAGSFYVIQPFGLPDKGNNLWYPNSGVWGVHVNYSGMPGLGEMKNPAFTKDSYLVGGTDKIYELCFKCHSEYGWGTEGNSFTIPDSLNGSYGYKEGGSSDTTKEFNPNNLGFHPVVDIGANQPILPTGFDPENVSGPHYATGGSTSTVSFANTWNPGKSNGNCIEITGGTGAGQIRTIAGHDASGITRVDPYFTTAPAADSEFYIRKCSSYSTAEWPRFTGGTISITNGSSTATISGLTDGIPSTVIKGWYVYAGTLSGIPLSPPDYTTSGWFQVTGISAGASDAGTTTVDLTITPAPSADYSGSYALSAGLGNAFVPPYGPWSVMGCADCHDADDPRDPSGPHASSRQWMLRTLEAQMFPWYYGGLSGEGSSSTTDPAEVKMVGYPAGDNSGWNNGNAWRYTCHNCHRADVYRTANTYLPSGSSFVNFAWRNQGRVNHVPHSTGAYEQNIFTVFCFNCHGADNRAKPYSGEDEPYKALGGMHGSNLGIGNRLNGSTPAGASFRGRRLLNGATWTGVTRAYTNSGVKCYSGGQDSSVASCKRSYDNGVGNSARYAYYSGPDIVLPEMTSAVANDASGGNTGVQSGDQVVINFSGETNAPGITFADIDTALALNNGHSWGGILSAVWSTTNYTNDTLTVTLDSDATIEMGDTITSDGTIKSIVNSPITNSIAITGDFGHWLISAYASDASGGGSGVQAGDRVVVRFRGATAGTAITASNIDSALALSGGHSWKDGSGNIGSAVWSTTTDANDTLTVTLSAAGSAPTIYVRDTIVLDGTIRDGSNNPITDDPLIISGSFDSIPGGAVAQWLFDEGAGSIAYDDSGNGNNGDLYGAPLWSTGKSGNAVVFDYTDDYISVEDSDTLDLTSAGSIEIWAKKDQDISYQTYISKGNAYSVREENFGRLQFMWNGSYITTDASLAPGVWYHIVATCDGSTRKIYLNGELVKSGGCSTAAANADPLYIGYTGSSYFYDGVMDSVVLYNIALTADEVKARYNKLGSAIANDNSSSGEGVQAGDQVVITFNVATDAAVVDASNIDSVLALNGGHSWKDGSGGIGSAVWSTSTYANDTLTVTLSSTTAAPTLGAGDVITTDGTIKDGSGNAVYASVQISGSFGAMAGMPDNVVGYWKLDEGAGAAIADSSVYQNNGTATGDLLWTTGRFGGAMDLDPAAPVDYITVPDSNSLDLTSEMTVEFWVNKGSNASYQTFISKGVYPYGYIIDENNTTGQVRFIWGGTIVEMASPLSADTWHHIVGTYDGVEMKMYVDGNLEGSASISFEVEPNSEPLYIGRHSLGRYVDGIIDDVVIYNRALTQVEVGDRYGANLESAFAGDPSGNGKGLQAGDQVVISFNGATNGAAINASNIDSALALGGGHSWKDGSGNIGFANWSTSVNTNDTLVIGLSTASGNPTVAVGDDLTLDGTIKDTSARPIIGNTLIVGTFDSMPSGVVGYWNFEEGTGITAYDSSGNGHDGTLNGSPPWTAGRYGTGLDFVPNDYVLVADSDDLDLTGNGTIEFWLQKDTHRNNQLYVYKGSQFYIRDYSTQGRIQVRWGNASIFVSDTVLSTGMWHHIAVTYDGSFVRLYIDGELDKSAAWSTNNAAATNDMYFGGTAYMDGKLDEIVIYNRALDAAEIKGRFGTHPDSAVASDASTSGAGVQGGDQVVIRFNEATDGAAINSGNIDTALALNGSSWLDGGGNIGSAVWSTTTYSNDTLTVTLSDATSAPTMGIGDTITLDAATIKDSSGYPVDGSVPITGSFGAIAGMPDGVVGYWKLDENTGTGITDESANSNDGSTSGGPFWVTGRFNSALNFIPNDHINIPDSNSLDLVDQGTVELWVKRNSNQNSQMYVTKGNSNYPRLQLGDYGTTGQVQFLWHTGALQSNTILDTGIWYHVVATYDGIDIKIYINGVLDASAGYKTDRLPANGNALYVGKRNDGYFYDGDIDEVVIYNRAIDASEVQQRFVNGIASIEGVDNTYGGIGIQPGDYALISFMGATNGASITSANIDAVLLLSNGHSWLDGAGEIAYANWTSINHTNDTLVVGLSGGGGSVATVAGGDTVTLGGSIIKDNPLNRDIAGSQAIRGDFDVPGGSIGVWWLDEGSGTSAGDSTTNVNDGTISGASWTSGHFGNALSFNGSSDYVSFATNSDFSLPGSYTIEAWIKPTAYNNDGPVVASNSDYLRYSFGLNVSGKLTFSYKSDGSIVGRNIAESNDSLPLNEWTHIAVIRNGGSGSTATFYINGQSSGTFVDDHYTGGTIDLVAGKTAFDFDYFFSGYIDDLIIYDKALSTSELKKRYRTWATNDVADNNSGGGAGVQAGDRVVIIFDGETDAAAINAGNINTVLALNNGHSWLDGSGNIGSAAWSTTTNTNDTLTVTLSDATGAPTVAAGDVVTFDGTIKDNIVRSITGTVTVTGSFAPVPADAVAYYKFDEASGNTVVDGTSRNNHGTIYGSATRSVSGKVGGAISFDGIDDYVEIIATDFNLANAVSVEFWMKAPVQTNGEGMVAADAFLVKAWSGETNSGVTTDTGWQGSSWVVGGNVFDDAWHHVVLTWDGSTQKLYVDGSLDPDTKGGTGTLVSQDTLRFGNQLLGDFWFGGLIDEVVIYNKALSQADVTNRYNNP